MTESSQPTVRTHDALDVDLSVLDLAPVTEGGTVTEALDHTLDLARHAERLGYRRFWLAEHHGMPGIASSATSVLIGYVAGGTRTIRVGSGGVMLPNHASLAIAEQFGTLESLYPGRIDLGLGRAPGSDQPAARALRRGLPIGGNDFPDQLEELRGYFRGETESGARPLVRAYPGEGLNVPIWLLGSSGFSATLAGQLGLPFSFASHFAPDYLLEALDLYRSNFRPSETLQQPHVMVGLNIVAADGQAEAERLATSHQLQFLSLIRGRPVRMQPPVDSMEGIWSPHEAALVHKQLRYSLIGDRARVRDGLARIVEETGADELIVSGPIYDHEARLRSYAIAAEAAGIRPAAVS
ncbi:LLM class flavin-dependent oxidoreductase [Paenibacillus sp. IB182496]|uniref:LLM class flavin-dependent oxidoreductase n=1 Tax=Paenibacillus sabuli TaxID=2772509 RepID=A0A927BQM8_9BACL|nr:LLM class flavin-dependent oxidoreductase [Paenibacillus sabuli]MBD2843769.1 LLM class flavin-dependent oxidoreductase [Paenibacillus sabuli]